MENLLSQICRAGVSVRSSLLSKSCARKTKTLPNAKSLLTDGCFVPVVCFTFTFRFASAFEEAQYNAATGPYWPKGARKKKKKKKVHVP